MRFKFKTRDNREEGEYAEGERGREGGVSTEKEGNSKTVYKRIARRRMKNGKEGEKGRKMRPDID